MPVKPETTSAELECLRCKAAEEVIQAIRKCTQPAQFQTFIGGLKHVAALNNILLTHPSAQLEVRHRLAHDVDSMGRVRIIGEQYLVTSLIACEDDPEPQATTEQWEFACAAVEVLSIQGFVVEGPIGERSVIVKGTSTIPEVAPRCLVILHRDATIETVRAYSNDLLTLLLAEFCFGYGLPSSLCSAIREQLFRLSNAN
jgi:hypothetical protein